MSSLPPPLGIGETFPITIASASVLSLIYVKQSFDVIGYRTQSKIALGTYTKENVQEPELLRRTRIHGNFAEYIPLALILLGMLEGIQFYPSYVVAGFGVSIIAGRFLHWYALANGKVPVRVAGMVLTLNSILFMSLLNIASLAMMHY